MFKMGLLCKNAVTVASLSSSCPSSVLQLGIPEQLQQLLAVQSGQLIGQGNNKLSNVPLDGANLTAIASAEFWLARHQHLQAENRLKRSNQSLKDVPADTGANNSLLRKKRRFRPADESNSDEESMKKNNHILKVGLISITRLILNCC